MDSAVTSQHVLATLSLTPKADVIHVNLSTLSSQIAHNAENPVSLSPVHQIKLLQLLAVSLAENAMLSPQTKEDVLSLDVQVIK
jgi:hypothetical protein